MTVELSANIGKILGIPIRIHWTLWLVFLLIAWSLADGYLPIVYPGLGALTYWAIGAVSALLLFISVLLHELSHSYIAKKNGLPIADSFNGLWIIFLGWFIRSGAETSLKQTEMTEALHGISVGDIMTRDLLTVSPDISVQKLVTDYFLIHPHGGYPVVRNDKLEGVVTMSSVRSIPAEKREMETVAQAMVPYERIVTISPNVSAAEALQKIAEKNIGRLIVTDGDRILGMITTGNLMKTIRTR